MQAEMTRLRSLEDLNLAEIGGVAVFVRVAFNVLPVVQLPWFDSAHGMADALM